MVPLSLGSEIAGRPVTFRLSRRRTGIVSSKEPGHGLHLVPVPAGQHVPSARVGRALAGLPPPARHPGLCPRLARRATVGLTGGAAVLAGVVMLVLPGPGLVTIALGFGILGREFAWATRVNNRVRDRLVAAGRTLAGRR